MKIAFLGLGNMGGPMAANLVRAGHEVLGHDPAGSYPEGVRAHDDAAAAVGGAEAVVTMLPEGGILRNVYEAVTPAARQGTLFIDCSTVDVESARAVAAGAMEAGHLAVDAPVSGGTKGAEDGTLTFMAGGTEAALDAAEPILAVMGKRTVRCGASGAGQAAKMCNNMILGATMVATCEAFVLADGIGLSREALFDVVSTSSGQSWSMSTYCPVPGVGPVTPADNGYRPGFSAALMLKDLRLSQQAASGAGAFTPMGARAAELFGAFVDDGNGGRDFSAIIEMLGKEAGD